MFVCSQLEHTYSAVFLLLVTAASDLLVRKILLNSVLLSSIISGGVRPKLPGQTLFAVSNLQGSPHFLGVPAFSGPPFSAPFIIKPKVGDGQHFRPICRGPPYNRPMNIQHNDSRSNCRISLGSVYM